MDNEELVSEFYKIVENHLREKYPNYPARVNNIRANKFGFCAVVEINCQGSWQLMCGYGASMNAAIADIDEFLKKWGK